MSLDAAQKRELRTLHEKAYARDGGLSDVDAVRMSELERQRRPGAADPATVQSAAVRAEMVSSPAVERRRSMIDSTLTMERSWVERSSVDIASSVDDASSGGTASSDDGASTAAVIDSPLSEDSPESGSGASSVREVLRRFWRPVTGVVAALLIIGIGLGWLLFGQAASGGIVLTDEQVQRRLELYESGRYDEDSVRAVGQDDDALVWYATRQDGDFLCIILDVGERSANSCQSADEAGRGGIGTNVNGGGTDPDTGEEQNVVAYILHSTTGDPVAAIQRWSMQTDDDTWLMQFEGSERARAEALVAEGYDSSSLSIVGYFQDAPVWIASRQGDTGETEACLLADAADAQSLQCTPQSELIDEGMHAVVTIESADGTPSDWGLDVRYTAWQNPYLTITSGEAFMLIVKDGEIIEGGERVEVGGEHGDPIEVTPEDPTG